MKKMLICLFLAAEMIFLAACGTIPEEKPDTTSSDSTLVPGTETEPAETERIPYVETDNYNGAEVRILTMASGKNRYFFADEDTGDSLVGAIYLRTLQTEEYLGIDLTYYADCDYSELQGIVEQSVQAGDDEYQIVLADSMRGNTGLVAGG